jgi:hypothetical protein
MTFFGFLRTGYFLTSGLVIEVTCSCAFDAAKHSYNNFYNPVIQMRVST